MLWQMVRSSKRHDKLRLSAMTSALLLDLRARRTAICTQWEALLRVERVSGPLAHPDTLVYLIPNSLDQIFANLAKDSLAPKSSRRAKIQLPACDCGNNPYLAYFLAGEQALVEAVVLLQAELQPERRHKHDVSEIILTVRQLARSEIDTFCGVCSHHGVALHCRHAVARGAI